MRTQLKHFSQGIMVCVGLSTSYAILSYMINDNHYNQCKHKNALIKQYESELDTLRTKIKEMDENPEASKKMK